MPTLRGTCAETEDATIYQGRIFLKYFFLSEALALKQRMQLYGSKVIIQCQARLRGTCAETEDATLITMIPGIKLRSSRGTCAETEDATKDFSNTATLYFPSLRGTCAETEDATLIDTL